MFKEFLSVIARGTQFSLWYEVLTESAALGVGAAAVGHAITALRIKTWFVKNHKQWIGLDKEFILFLLYYFHAGSADDNAPLHVKN
jgi:hypothetical protein